LRRYGREGADAHAQHHGEEDFEMKKVQKALNRRVE
jgi:hypothetical protein